MNPVKKKDFIKIDYIGYADNKVFDTSLKEIAEENDLLDDKRVYKPLEFEVGSDMMIPGINDAVIGMKEGEEKEAEILPENAYGVRKEDRIKTYSRKMLEKQGIEFYPGVKLIINTPEGILRAVVVETDENNVVLDFNHELAGKILKFKIFLREIINLECS